MKKQCQETQHQADKDSRAEEMCVKIPYVPGITDQMAKFLWSNGMKVAHSSESVRSSGDDEGPNSSPKEQRSRLQDHLKRDNDVK